jgi:hypothetical protein
VRLFRDGTFDMGSHPWFPKMRISGRGEYILRSPLDIQTCAERMSTAVMTQTGLMSMRLYGTVEGREFKVRHASAIDVGALTKWASGRLEPSGDETVIRFRFGPLRYLLWIMRINSTVFTSISLILIASLIVQLLTRPALEVSDDLKAITFMFTVPWLFIMAMFRLMNSASEPSSLIRLLATLLDAEVVENPNKKRSRAVP